MRDEAVFERIARQAHLVVMRYADSSRYPVGVLPRNASALYHVTKPTQFHDQTNSPVGVDVGTLVFLERNQLNFHHRVLQSPIVFSLNPEAALQLEHITAPLVSRPEVRERVFAPLEMFDVVPYYFTPVIPNDNNEITINEQGDVISIGVDTRNT